MKQTTIPIKSDARISIKCNSDLSIEGKESNTLTVIVDQGDSLRMREENDAYRISADSNCHISLPSSVAVTIEKTGGDCELSGLKGRVLIGKVGADLHMNQLGGASIESVGDDCWIHDALGAIEIARIGNNLTANQIESLIASSVGGDARLTHVNGKVDIVTGDELALDLRKNTNISEIRARAGSDIKCYLSPEAQCQLTLSSGGEEINVHAAGQDVEIEKRELTLPLGNGGETVNLIAGDAIMITDRQAPEWEDDRFDWWNEDHWRNFGDNISRKVKESLKYAGISIEQAMQQAENASREAGRQVEKVFRDLDEKGFGRRDKVVGFSVNSNSQTSNQSSAPTDEERLLVLKMLQEKKITVEEAEKLLNALDR